MPGEILGVERLLFWPGESLLEIVLSIGIDEARGAADAIGIMQGDQDVVSDRPDPKSARNIGSDTDLMAPADCVATSRRAMSRSMVARPHIWRFSVFSRTIWPSV